MRIVLLSVAAIAFAACTPATPTDSASAPATADASGDTGGDTAVEASDLPLDQVAQKLTGKWRSMEDPKSTITIDADGDWFNDYEMDPPTHTESKWRLFKGSDGPADAGVTFEPDSYYLEVKDADGALYNSLGMIEKDSFEMFYTARGNRLAFERIN